MRKKNGFVFMETIVVVSVLSITLLTLFTSYSYILRKSRERNTFDTTEMIYKTYFVKEILYELNPTTDTNSVVYFINRNLTATGTNKICTKVYNSYICDLSQDTYNGELIQIKKVYEVDKFYYLNPNEILSHSNKKEYLLSFDATTIDYINNLGKSVNRNLLVVKYKKYYNSEGTEYEVIHSSMEV